MSDTQNDNQIDIFLYKALRAIGFSIDLGRKRDFWVPVIEKMVLSLSDQQLLTGLAVLIAGFWTHCSISVYHFALVNDLAWFSATTHVTTLNVLQGFFMENPVLKTSRVILMVVMGILLVASSVMEGHHAWFDSRPYDAQCLFDDLSGNIGGGPRYWMCVNLAMLFVFYPLGIITLYKGPSKFVDDLLEKKPRKAPKEAIQHLQRKQANHNSSSVSKGRRKRWSFTLKRFSLTLQIALVSIAGWIYLFLGAIVASKACNLAIDSAWFGYSVWCLVKDREIPASEMDGNENAMSFGQIVPILLLSSILLVGREAYDDQSEKMGKDQHSRSNSSQRSLVRTRDSAAVSSTASTSFEMSGRIQDTEDDVEPEIPPPRRVDTEMGGRSHTSPFEGQRLQRRPTYPPGASDTELATEESDQSE